METQFELVFDLKMRRGFFTRTVKYGIRFDMICYFTIMKELGIKLGDEVNSLSKHSIDEVLTVAVYAGGRSYAFEHNLPFKYTREDIDRWVEDSIITRKHWKDIGKMWTEFIASFADADKKKVKANQ